MRLPPLAILSLCVLAFVGSAAAHPIDAGAGLAAGFAHPLSGLDHVLAMVAVGLWAAQLGGRALWLVPSAFVAMMLAGGALGAAGVGVPAVEIGVAGSVLLLGLLIAFGVRAPLGVSMALVGGFAILHGHAHGSAMPAGAGALDAALGRGRHRSCRHRPDPHGLRHRRSFPAIAKDLFTKFILASGRCAAT